MDDVPTVSYNGHQLPATWLIGGFVLEAANIEAGELDDAATALKSASGHAWLRLPHTRAHPMIDRDWFARVVERDRFTPDTPRLLHAVEVVDKVAYPETQVSIADALVVRPGARIGDTIAVDFTVDRSQLRDIVWLGRGFLGWLDTDPLSARFAVAFRDLDLDFAQLPGRGLVRGGIATYPIAGSRRPIEIVLGGFTIVIPSLRLTTKGGTAQAHVMLPGSISEAASCQPATIDLGTIALSPTSSYYFDEPAATFGPWLLGETGMVIKGAGYVLDLSTATSPAPYPPAWRGLLLRSGGATGSPHIPDPCNTGYLRGHYLFADAIVVDSGFAGRLNLASPVVFAALNPLGQRVEVNTGWLDVAQSRIAGGELFDVLTELPGRAVWEGTGPGGTSLRLKFLNVHVQPDLDLTGVTIDTGHELAWGELTRAGSEVIACTATNGVGYLFLPAGPFASYSPVATGPFVSPLVDPVQTTQSLANLDGAHAAGVTFAELHDVRIYSPDRPGGTANPIRPGRVMAWLRVGVMGVDGQLSSFSSLPIDDYGNPQRPGYADARPFAALISFNENKRTLAEFVTSAVSESHIGGYLYIPRPADIPRLVFEDMKLTSTAHLVGGNVVLPPGGVRLAYWDLQLVPTGPPNLAGVLSVRTGRILFLAAGISEPVHFARPFGLTWGELLAGGNLGALFLDFNDWGQRFDGQVFHPDAFQLSPYPGVGNPHLAVSGAIVFRYFGVAYVNLTDAALVGTGSSPHPRWVEAPKATVTPNSGPTDLHLQGVWYDRNSNLLARFDCPDAKVDYNTVAQSGFLGTGGAELGFLHSLDLDITVEIQAAATDIRITATTTHDLALSTLPRLGALNEIAGSVRIDGPTISRLTMYGMFEHSAAAGSLFGPKAGYSVETNFTVTPTSLDFYVAGDMMLGLGITEVEASGTAHLLFDFATSTAEGEFFGRIDSDAALSGVSGEGQLTWHISPAMQYLQGRVKVKVFSLIGGSALEGGFFVGNNVPNALAWALDTTDPHFRMSRAILPATITGFYGYGVASAGFNLYILGGGVDIFVGAGAFSAPVSDGSVLAPFAGNPLLPYVVGACGIHAYGEILGGLVSASGWANLSLRGPVPPYFEGTFGLRGCVAWVLCGSVSITARLSDNGFELF